MKYDKEKHDLVEQIPVWHFWNPRSGFLGGLTFIALLICAFGTYITQGVWPALEFSFFTACIMLFARFIETKKIVLNYFGLFFWFAYVVSLLIGLERGENNVKISAFFFLTTLPFLTKSLMTWRKL